MNRLERLLNLVAALLDAGRPLSRHELQTLVPGYEGNDAAARRSFERDKDTLRSMGIPLVIEPLDPLDPELGEGYRIPREQYELPDPGLAPDELAALHLASSMVRLEGVVGDQAQEAIWKLGGAPVPAAAGAPGADVVALRGDEHLPALFAAIGERRTVRFAYRGDTRTVDPYRLAFRNGFWYLIGRDHDRASERSFRLDRIGSAPDAGPPGGFERPAAVAARHPRPWEMGEEDPVEVRVAIDADQAPWAVDQAGPDALVDQRPDGSVVVALRVTSRAALRSWVLGFLDHAEVLSPPEVRDDVVAWLRALAASAA